MKRYSQYDEQEHILRIFEGRPAGRFLDVGAYNPFEFSNTRALYELGWSGVMVEPSPGPMSSLVKEYGNEYPRIILVQAAVVTPVEDGLRWMYVTDDCVSTVLESEWVKWRRQANFLGSVMVVPIRLERLINFGPFDFVNLDVEGLSANLFLQAVCVLGWRPRCFCVEFDGMRQQLESAARPLGYESVYSNETNIVFVRQG